VVQFPVMPTAHAQLTRINGDAAVTLTITNPPDATWYTGVGIDNAPPGDPGIPVAFEAFTHGPYVRLRRIEIDPKRVYISTDANETGQYNLWIGIQSSQQFVDVQIDKSTNCDFFINTAAASSVSPSSAGQTQTVLVQLS